MSDKLSDSDIVERLRAIGCAHVGYRLSREDTEGREAG
jgi:hypothetical protein